MNKTQTQEILRRQNLWLRKWALAALILLFVGCSAVFVMSMAKELGLVGKTSVNLGFANIEVGSGESERLNTNQQQQLEKNAIEPVAQTFNSNNGNGYCTFEYGSYTFFMYPNMPYGPSNNGYYVATVGGGQFIVSDPLWNVMGISANSSGQWQIAGGDIWICSDPSGDYGWFR